MRPHRRGLRRGLLLSVSLVLAGTISIVACSRQEAGRQSSESGSSLIGGPFRLADTTGRTVSDQTLRGKPYAIFFGFTRCPDVCPTTLSRMAQLHERLGSDADQLNILFVSVDPEHDKKEDIASYLTLFPAPIIGLTGTSTQLAQIEQAFRVYVRKVPLEGGDYTVDHTATIYLMDREGRFFEPMSASEPIDVNLDQLRKLIRS